MPAKKTNNKEHPDTSSPNQVLSAKERHAEAQARYRAATSKLPEKAIIDAESSSIYKIVGGAVKASCRDSLGDRQGICEVKRMRWVIITILLQVAKDRSEYKHYGLAALTNCYIPAKKSWVEPWPSCSWFQTGKARGRKSQMQISLLSITIKIQDGLRAKFFQGAKFKSVEDQDSSSQKSWYLVWDVGLFTSRTEAKAYLDNPSSQALTQHLRRSDALEKWGLLCGKHHHTTSTARLCRTRSQSKPAKGKLPVLRPQHDRELPSPTVSTPTKSDIRRIIKEESPPLRIKRESPPLQPSPLLQPSPPLQPSRSSSRVVELCSPPDDTDYYFDSDSPDASPVSGAHVQSRHPATTSTPLLVRGLVAPVHGCCHHQLWNTGSSAYLVQNIWPRRSFPDRAPGPRLPRPPCSLPPQAPEHTAPARTSLKTPAPVVRAPPAASGTPAPAGTLSGTPAPLILLGVLPPSTRPTPAVRALPAASGTPALPSLLPRPEQLPQLVPVSTHLG
ncbi:hypothetical protein B0H14DRAFT_2640813 [Mycena olivaceomarginata]|nr:hypothetical protein B0H14DRAFT_2640813 [Mycena olivaceomarginata]